jgi:hypothetical protein
VSYHLFASSSGGFNSTSEFLVMLTWFAFRLCIRVFAGANIYVEPLN